MKNKFCHACSQLAFLAVAVTFVVTTVPSSSKAADLKHFGLLAGFNFPKVAFAEADINLFEHWGIDYEFSLGLFWSIQQGDLLYYFTRGEWSPYVGVGYQNWNFFGFSSSTNYNGVVFGSGSQAESVTVPLGLLFVADSGFGFNLNIAGDVFTNAPSGLQGRVIPEAGLAVGYFF